MYNFTSGSLLVCTFLAPFRALCTISRQPSCWFVHFSHLYPPYVQFLARLIAGLYISPLFPHTMYNFPPASMLVCTFLDFFCALCTISRRPTCWFVHFSHLYPPYVQFPAGHSAGLYISRHYHHFMYNPLPKALPVCTFSAQSTALWKIPCPQAISPQLPPCLISHSQFIIMLKL